MKNIPFPELQIGDVLKVYYPRSNEKDIYVYLGEGILWCSNDCKYVRFPKGLEEYVQAVIRKSESSFETVEMWRADNEKLQKTADS